VALFIAGVLEDTSDAELAQLLEPFGPLLRAFVVSSPQVRCLFVSTAAAIA
jgi:hypothetical protein